MPRDCAGAAEGLAAEAELLRCEDRQHVTANHCIVISTSAMSSQHDDQVLSRLDTAEEIRGLRTVLEWAESG